MTPAGDPPDPQAEPFGAIPEHDHRNGDSHEAGADKQGDFLDEDLGAHPDHPDDPDDPDDPGRIDDPPLDDQDPPDEGPHTALPTKIEAWRKRSATGAVLTGFALGLQQAFEKEREQPSIVMQTSGDPPTDLPVEADVEHGRPRQSKVSIRPWLLRKGTDKADASGTAESDRPRPEPPPEDT